MGRLFKVQIIIVTYGNRANFVKRTVKRVLSFSTVSRVIIVDNNSSPESKRLLEKIADGHNDKIELIHNSENAGPGRAIRTALESGIRSGRNSFFWILDDDNLPKPDALDVLTSIWNKFEIESKNENLIAASFRKDRPNYLRAVRHNSPNEIMGIPNIFRSFHIKKAPSLLIQKVLRPGKTENTDKSMDTGEIPVAPYGGMFFHPDLVIKHGYPDSEYYLYFDDYEFSRRVIREGGHIILACKSIIEDQEQSWYNKGFGFMRLATQKNRTVMYYSVRNRILFEKEYLVSSKPVYLLNGLIYCGIMFSAMLITLNFKNIRVFSEALLDGFRGRKGIRKKYMLK
jgi:GT2 family glycosyltransferase